MDDKEIVNDTLKEREIYLLDYPGNVKDEERALASLGGREAVLRGFSTGQFEMTPRTGDLFAHHLTGKTVDTPLRIVFQKDGYGGTIVKRLGVFKTIFDFQFQPEEKYENNMQQALELLGQRKKEDLLAAVKKLGIRKLADETFLGGETLFPPPFFSTRQAPWLFSDLRPDNRLKMGKEHILNFPQAPESYRKPLPAEPEKRAMLEKIKGVFVEREIATRIFLRERLPEIEENRLKELLPYCAAYYKNGPWRGAWIAREISPLKQPLLRKYQTLITKFHVLPDLGKPIFRQKEKHLFDGKQLTENLHILQYCDLIDPDFVELVGNPPQTETLNRNDGWYPTGTKLALKRLLREKTKKILLAVENSSTEMKQQIKTYLFTIEKYFGKEKKKAGQEEIFELLESD